jgi:hypothetical protein
MLVSWDWSIGLTLVWGFNPIPSTISVSPKTPSILKTTLIGGSSSKAYHHSGSTACLAKSCRVINSHLRSFTPAIEFNPREWSFLDTQAPYIIDCFLSSISSKDQKVWLRKDDGMTISSARSRTDNRHNHPLGLILAISHIEQIKIVTGQ